MSDQTQVIVESGQTSGPLTLERTLQLLDEFCAIYPIADNIDFRICATQEELYGPQASRDRVGTIQGGYIPATRSDQARQATFRGQCDLAYSSFRDEIDFGRCLHHEIAGHFGLNTCTADEKRAVLESILLSRQEPGIDELWARVNHNYADQPDLKRAEELYCTLAEELATFPAEVFEATQTLLQLGLAGPRIVQIDELRSVVAHVATGLHENTRDQVIFPVDRQAQFSRTASEKQPFHEVVANELIRQIEAGTAPWQKPWNADGGIGGMPLNPTTGKRYKGINAIHLLAQGHSDPRWLTYKQAVSLDAQVRKGERGTSIQYWKFEDTRVKTDESGKPVMGADGTPVQERYKLENPRVFYATVFNAEQIDGLAQLVVPELSWDPVERAEQILTNSGARIEHAASDRAYYSPSRDEIHLPLQAQFPSARNYYATALHELGHWTGHESRLKRDLRHPFRSEGYAREELRAEIASMMLSAELGLPHDPSQHAAYVASWVSVLKKDPLEIFRAAADAEKIHALAMSFAPELAKDLNPYAGVATPTPDISLAQSHVAQGISPLTQPELATVIDPAPTSAPAANKVISMPLQPLSVDDVRDALSYISPNLPRDDWARIGMALKSEFPNDMGLDLFDQWSSTGEGYERNSVISTWRSIRADGAVKVGTLLKQAQDNGFKPRQDSSWRGPSAPRMDAATQAAQATAAAKEQKERLSQQHNAAAQAQQMWRDAQPGSDAAYLQRKNVQAHGTRTTANGTLLVPLVDEQGTLWNVQRILPTKLDNGTDKLFLKGGRKSGLFHVIGNVGSSPDQPILFAEGYATAASLHEATGWPAVVCLDAGNLIKVTNQFRTRRPDALMIVAGDDDTKTMATKGVNPGRQKAGLAAEQTKAVLAFPQGLTPEHSDFNDLVAQLGTHAGHEQIRTSLHDGLQAFLQTAAVARVYDEQDASYWAHKAKMASEAMQTLQSQGLPAQASQAQAADVGGNQLTAGEVAVVSSQGVPARFMVEDAPEFPAPAVADLNESVDAPSNPAAEPASDTTTFTGTPSPDPSAGVQISAPTAADVSPASAVAPTTDIPIPRPDPNNDLNLDALQAKRVRDALQVRQEMGKAPDSTTQTGSSGFEQNPSQGMNSISAPAPAQEPGPNTYLYQELRALRERLAKEYQHDGAGKYFFRQGKLDLAFEDTGSKFKTAHHAPEVVASIAQLAHAKGWREMYLTGTVEFRREMWLQASLLNMKVIGYEPEAIDQVRLTERRLLMAKDQALNPAADASVNSVTSGQVPNPGARPTDAGSAGATSSNLTTSAPSTPPVKSTPAPALLSSAAAKQLDSQLRDVLGQKGAAEPQAMELTLSKLYSQVQSPRVYLGQLLEHGSAPYKFDPKEQDSYFVKLQTKSGPQTVWGVDLPRALAEMLPNGENAIGQDILLAFQGVKKVQALVPQKDASGQPAPEKWELVDRNTWFAQPVMQAYAQSQQELAQMPPIEASTPTVTTPPTAQIPTEIASQGSTPAKPAQAMQALAPAADRLRNALTQLGTDPLQAEITVASMQNLFASPKFQVGKLLEHGQAPLKFTQGQPLSYYLKLSTEQGHVLLWSADFPRAINSTPVLLGQTVVAAYRGIELVQDGTRPATPRNDWLVAPLDRLHEDAQHGVVQRMSNAQTMVPSPAPAANAPQEQQALYILREAMRQAGIPQEFAQATLKDAQQLLGTAQAPIPASLGQPGQPAQQGPQVASVRPGVHATQLSQGHSVSKKVGPSL
jgi:antirestriction protein ArdC/phage/plasmid primase-like uncharacterized protein